MLQLVAKGCEVPSDQPQSFYRCLLFFKAPIPEALGDKHYREMLLKADADVVHCPVPKRRRGAGVEVAAAPVVAAPVAPCMVVGDPSSSGEEEEEEVVAVPPPPAPWLPGPGGDLVDPMIFLQLLKALR